MTTQDYSSATQKGLPPGHPGPWISIDDAAQWAEISKDEVWDAVNDGRLRLLRLTKRLVRVEEREVGRVFGLPLPGPRELEIAAEREAKKKPPTPPKRPVAAADHWLYWLYDDTGLLLYIGITNSGVKRMEAHGAQKEWWPRVATIKVDHFETRDDAEAAETEAIRRYLPIHNVRDSVRFQKGRLC